MKPPLQQAIGIDIGGTKIALAAVDGSGRLLAQTSLATEAERGFPRAVGRIIEAIDGLLHECQWKAEAWQGVGIGCAGPVDPARGLINNPYTLIGWDQCDVVTPLRERFAVPVRLENDADAAVVGECLAGAGRGFDPVVMLTFGTGVGGAAMFGGRIYRGVGGEHPELGHLVVDPAGPDCYCGGRGCLESLASGTAIGAAGQSAGFSDARAVFTAARSGDPMARGVLDRAIAAAVEAAWTVFHTFLPQRLVLGGGLMDEQFDWFAEPIRMRLRRATQFTATRVEVVRAELGNHAGLVGAAALMFGVK